MAITATQRPVEDFIVQINGDYNVPFNEMALSAAAAPGAVIAVGSGFGIVGSAVAGTVRAANGQYASGTRVRVMVRGNPTTVNAQALVGYVAATHDAALAAVGIIVVNK